MENVKRLHNFTGNGENAFLERICKMHDSLNETMAGDVVLNRSLCRSESSSSDTMYVFLTTASIVIIFVIAIAVVLSNTLVILAIARTETMRRPSHWLIANLAASDLGVGLYALLLYPAQYMTDPGKLYCVFAKMVVLMLTTVSQVTLLMITIDRYIAITRPLLYYQIVTPSRIKPAIVFSWVYPLMVSLTIPIASGWYPGSHCSYEATVGTVGVYFTAVHFFTIVFIMCAIYSKVI